MTILPTRFLSLQSLLIPGILCGVFLLAAPLQTASFDPRGEGSQVVVLYNSHVPESRDLADYYAARRGVPANQIIGLRLPTDEQISRRDFQNRLQEPLIEALEKRGLLTIDRDRPASRRGRAGATPARVSDASIRYLTICYGVPVQILSDPALLDAASSEVPEPLRRNDAAVDSELAVLPMRVQELSITGPIANPVFAHTNAASIHPTNGVLIVGRLDGPTPEVARRMIDQAIQAETNGLWGRAYFDLRGTSDPGLQRGERWLAAAAETVRRVGYEAVIDLRPETFPIEFPMSHIAFYAGWYDPHASGPFTRSMVEFMPGAIVYHLHSFNAVSIRTPDRHWVGPLLARGATATFGTVSEPYLELTTDLSVFWGLLVGRAFSFGEAALAAQPALSWQSTIVGDPLYRPFGRLHAGEHIGTRFLALHADLTQRQSPWLAWSILQAANFRLLAGESPASILTELEADPRTQQSPILQEKLGDLHAQNGDPAHAIRAYERALQLEPSPQQRTRLSLTLAESLAAHSNQERALELYQSFLMAVPDYPAPLAIHRSMLPLAQSLGRTDDVARILDAIDRLESAPTPAP